MQPIDQRKFNEMVANCERILTQMNKRITALEEQLKKKPRQKKPNTNAEAFGEEAVEC